MRIVKVLAALGVAAAAGFAAVGIYVGMLFGAIGGAKTSDGDFASLIVCLVIVVGGLIVAGVCLIGKPSAADIGAASDSLEYVDPVTGKGYQTKRQDS